MDFKIDFNIDFSDNEFEKYLANPSQYIEDAKAKMRENAYKKARAELEATRQKAVALAKIQAELNAYQQELQVEINQFKQNETKKIMASIGNSTAPRTESPEPSAPQVESPKVANSQPSNPKASQQKSSTQKSEKPKDNKKATTTESKTTKAGKPKKESRPERIKRMREELKEEEEIQMANDLISAIFDEAYDEEYPSGDVYKVLKGAQQENLDHQETMRRMLHRAIDHGANLDKVASYYHDYQKERLGDKYDFDETQAELEDVFRRYADNYQPMVNFNEPADADEHEENTRRLESIPDFSNVKRSGGY